MSAFFPLHSNLLKPSPDLPRRNFFSKSDGFRSEGASDGGAAAAEEAVAAADTVATAPSAEFSSLA